MKKTSWAQEEREWLYEQLKLARALVVAPRPESRKPPHDRELRWKLYGRLLPLLRAKAREMGYALGLHGSLSYDLDLIAAPWTDPLATPFELFDAFTEVIKVELGIPYVPKNYNDATKPHGRISCLFHLQQASEMDSDENGSTYSPYIDLAILQPAAPRTPSIW